jgi:hypothetical protein
MLLFTWDHLFRGIGHLFQWTFRLMEMPNRNVNIVFIVIGFIGVGYWLNRQTQYNKEADQNRTIK